MPPLTCLIHLLFRYQSQVLDKSHKGSIKTKYPGNNKVECGLCSWDCKIRNMVMDLKSVTQEGDDKKPDPG